MLETISAWSDVLPGPKVNFHPMDLPKWTFHPNCMRLAKKWKPAGISDVRINLDQDRQPSRVVVEANLTSALFGPDFAYASLREKDLRPAGSAVLNKLNSLLAGTSLTARLPLGRHEDLGRWRLGRLDPSTTVLLPSGTTVSDVVRGTAPLWDLERPQQSGVLSHHKSNGETLTLKFANWRSWSIYDKTAEAAARNKLIADRLLRIEARIFLGASTSGIYKDWTPTLAFSDFDVEMIARELFLMMERITAADKPKFSFYFQTFKAAGYTEKKALELTALLALRGEGVDITEDLSPKQAQRLRKEVRDAGIVVATAGREGAELDFSNPVIAFDETVLKSLATRPIEAA